MTAAIKDTTVLDLVYHRHNRRAVYRYDWRNPYPTARDSWISLDFTLFVILITIVITIAITIAVVTKLIITTMRQMLEFCQRARHIRNEIHHCQNL